MYSEFQLPEYRLGENVFENETGRSRTHKKVLLRITLAFELAPFVAGTLVVDPSWTLL